MDRREQERAVRRLAKALNDLDGAKERVDRALVAAVNVRAGTAAQELMGLPHATFWRRVKSARKAVGA
jgi:hypothetical protein